MHTFMLIKVSRNVTYGMWLGILYWWPASFYCVATLLHVVNCIFKNITLNIIINILM